MRFSLPQKKLKDNFNNIDVLIIGNDYHDSLESSYFFALKERKYNPYIISLDNYYNKKSFSLLNKYFFNKNLNKLFFFNPIDNKYLEKHYKFIIVFNVVMFKESVMKRLSEITKNLIFIYADNPFSSNYCYKEIFKYAKYFDQVFFWSEKIVKLFKEHQKNTYFLDFAWDERTFPKTIRSNNFDGNLAFIGGWDEYREKKIIDLLDINGLHLDIYGPPKYWKKSKRLGKYFREEVRNSLAAEVMSECLNLNFLRKQNEDVDGLNMRVFEVLGSGNFLIMKKNEALKKLLPGLNEKFNYESIDQVKEIKDKILKNYELYDKENYEIVQNIRENHTYINRINTIEKYLK